MWSTKGNRYLATARRSLTFTGKKWGSTDKEMLYVSINSNIWPNGYGVSSLLWLLDSLTKMNENPHEV